MNRSFKNMSSENLLFSIFVIVLGISNILLLTITNLAFTDKVICIFVNSVLSSASSIVTLKTSWNNKDNFKDNFSEALSFAIITSIGICAVVFGIFQFISFRDLNSFERLCVITGSSMILMIVGTILVKIRKNSVKKSIYDMSFFGIVEKKWKGIVGVEIDDVRCISMHIGMHTVLDEVLERQKKDPGLMLDVYRNINLKDHSVAIQEYKNYLESLGQRFAVDEYSKMLNQKIQHCQTPGIFFTTIDSEQTASLHGVFYCKTTGVIMILGLVMDYEILKR